MLQESSKPWKRWLVAAALVAVSTSAIAARQCRVQHCWEIFGVELCYYDSGWFDC